MQYFGKYSKNSCSSWDLKTLELAKNILQVIVSTNFHTKKQGFQKIFEKLDTLLTKHPKLCFNKRQKKQANFMNKRL